MYSVTSVRALILALFIIDFSASAQGVGDSAFDANKDNANFKLCNPERVWQGYQLKTKMDETSIAVAREFQTKFKTNDAWKNENGIIRIRFVVNCSGAADRFRILSLGFDLNEKQFNKELEAHVLSIAKDMQWPARRAHQQTVDYYFHISVRIVNGELNDIVQ